MITYLIHVFIQEEYYMDKQDSTETKISILSARIEQLQEKLDKKDGLLAGFAKNCLEHLARYLIIAVLAIGVFFVVKDMAFSGVNSVLSIPGKGIDWIVAKPGNLGCRFLDSTCRMEDGIRIYELVPETEMSEEYIKSVSKRYIELYENITGETFVKADISNIQERIKNNVLAYLSL